MRDGCRYEEMGERDGTFNHFLFTMKQEQKENG